jgi:rSAM/selenodomain-associated transferase 1
MESLLVFVKAPVAGRVKTRLAAERGIEAATLLASAFLDDTAALVARWRAERTGVDPNRNLVFVCAPDAEDPVLARAAKIAGGRTSVQVAGDLGARLRAAFDAEFRRGARAVCAIGMDSPTLPLHLIDHAFRALEWERVVLGPTFDGGYWLVGAQRPAPDLFTDIPWSTHAVLARTLQQLKRQSVEPALLPFWYDVDEAADLERLVWHVRALRERDPTLAPSTWNALVRIGLIRQERAA